MFTGKERDGKINQIQTTKRSVRLCKLTSCIQGDVCRQGKRWENQSSSDNKVVSECVQTYKLHRLCHRVVFGGKEGDGQINQVQTIKRSLSV